MEWYSKIIKKFKATPPTDHMFLLHLAVNDLILKPKDDKDKDKGMVCMSVTDHLKSKMGCFRIVVSYNRSAGITFATPAMELEFKKLLCPEISGSPEAKKLTEKIMSSPLPASPLEALPLLERVLRMSKREASIKLGVKEELLANLISIIIGFAETIAPANDLTSASPEDRTNIVTLARWARHPEIEKSGNLIILLTKNIANISDCLRNSSCNVESIKIPLPNFEERQQFITYLLSQQPGFQLSGLDARSLAAITAGLTRENLRDLAFRCVNEKIALTPDIVWDSKKEILESTSGGLLEIVRPDYGFEMVGGLEDMKSQFKKVGKAIISGDILKVPMGILLLGPPGTCKTLMATALANEVGFCLAKYKNVRDMWVGKSERNQTYVNELIVAMAPVIVFMDEIDQAEQARGNSFSGDSGVSERMRANQFAFMSETANRGKILFIAATNRPDLMDQAMLRSGRFDLMLPFLSPEENDLPQIFPAIFRKMTTAARKYQVMVNFNVDPNTLLPLIAAAKKRDEFFNGSDIELICHRAYELASDREHLDREVTVNSEDLANALEDWIPSKDAEAYRHMTMLALKEIKFKAFLPEKYRNMPMEEILSTIHATRQAMEETDQLRTHK